MPQFVFGIRHHGPGCARSLTAALDEVRPDCIAIEGPPDAIEVLTLAGHDELQPPVALLVYPADEPRRAAYFPLAIFSPEWQAIRWAIKHDVPVRFIDLPQSNRIAIEIEREKELAQSLAKAASEEAAEPEAAIAAEGLVEPDAVEAETPAWRSDPLSLLAEAAGYEDHELWWDEQVERRRDAAGLFAAIIEAMRAVREHAPEVREIDLTREAFMRQSLRGIAKEGFDSLAVVCGAWHAPVLDEQSLAGKRDGCAVKEDAARLRGLPKVKTTATWIPWTYDRLTFRSGYGAGVTSPGWYEHLWTSHEHAAIRWVATAARLLRNADIDAPSAGVIEAVRLADALAAMRDVRSAGLSELNEAILTVLCHGEPSPLRLIREQLEIGERLGSVPADAPTVPLVRDLEAQQRSLRLKPSAAITPLDLDLRTENGIGRSRLLHRLNLLELPWGKLQGSGGRTSTFHEIWQLEWKPEFAVAAIEANVWGNTIVSAATARVTANAQEATELPALTALLDHTVLAGLDEAMPALLARLQAQSAIAADVRHLMEALPPLARVTRYGDVRGTRAEQVLPIAEGMFERCLVGLRSACSGLDEDAAERMIAAMSAAREAIDLLDRSDLKQEWFDQLRRLADDDVHGLLRGWCVRQLLEANLLDDDELERLTRTALSPAVDPSQAAAWASGLLRGSGLLLLHRDELWPVFDKWLADLTSEAFVELLPLIRRASPTSARRNAGRWGREFVRFPRVRPSRGRRRRLDRQCSSRSKSNGPRKSCRFCRTSLVPRITGRSPAMATADEERLRRWRLVLGKDASDALSSAGALSGTDAGMDAVLEALYDANREGERSGKRSAGLGPSSPNVNRWLGDIRTYFPASVVRRDAEGRPRTAKPSADAARARDPVEHGSRRATRRHAGQPEERDSAKDKGNGTAGRA